MKSLFEKISTWRERIGQPATFPLHAPTDVEKAMVGEIADLRAADCTVPPVGWYCTRAPGHDGPCAARRGGPALSDATGNREYDRLLNGYYFAHDAMLNAGRIEEKYAAATALDAAKKALACFFGGRASADQAASAAASTLVCLDGYLAACGYGSDHPWRSEIAAAQLADKSGCPAAQQTSRPQAGQHTKGSL